MTAKANETPQLRKMRQRIQEARSAWHCSCVACGADNPLGLRLDFCPSDGGGVEAAFSCDPAFSGYDGRLHGGIVATLMDAAMTHCLFAQGVAGVTGELKVRFRDPVDVAFPAQVRACLAQSGHGLYILRSEIVQAGAVKAAAEGKFVAKDKPKPPTGAPGGKP